MSARVCRRGIVGVVLRGYVFRGIVARACRRGYVARGNVGVPTRLPVERHPASVKHAL